MLYLNTLVQSDIVQFGEASLGMRELLDHVSIIGEKQQANRVTLKLANRINPFFTRLHNQRHDSLAPTSIVKCCNEILGLIQENISKCFLLDRLAIHLHDIARIDFRAELYNNLSVDTDYPSADQYISLTTATQASIR